MAAGLKWYLYTDDVGDQYNVQVESSWGDAAANGFAAFDVTKPYLPKRWRMREVHGVSSTGKARAKPVGSLAADLWTLTATTFDALDDAGASHTYNITSLIGERRRFGR